MHRQWVVEYLIHHYLFNVRKVHFLSTKTTKISLTFDFSWTHQYNHFCYRSCTTVQGIIDERFDHFTDTISGRVWSHGEPAQSTCLEMKGLNYPIKVKRVSLSVGEMHRLIVPRSNIDPNIHWEKHEFFPHSPIWMFPEAVCLQRADHRLCHWDPSGPRTKRKGSALSMPEGIRFEYIHQCIYIYKNIKLTSDCTVVNVVVTVIKNIRIESIIKKRPLVVKIDSSKFTICWVTLPKINLNWSRSEIIELPKVLRKRKRYCVIHLPVHIMLEILWLTFKLYISKFPQFYFKSIPV